MKTLRAILTLCLALGPAAAARAADNGTVSGLFLRLPASAAGTGMGEAGVAVVAGSPAIFVNPAGLAGLKGGYASFSHSAWAESLSFNTLSAAVRTRYGAAGMGLRYLSYGEIGALDNTGAPAGSMSPRDIALDAALASKLENGLSVGITGRYINSKIMRSASAVAFDLGVMGTAGRTFFGAALQNAGGGLEYGEDVSPLPLNLKLGAGLPYGRDFIAAVDLNLTRGAAPWVAVGGKYTLLVRDDVALAFRAGYNTASSDAGGLSGFALGVGVTGLAASFDYSLRTMGDFGLTHHIGLNFKWDMPEPYTAPRPSVLQYRNPLIR